MRILLSALLAFILVGCVQTAPVRVAPAHVAPPIYTLRINETSREEQFIEDIGISVKPLQHQTVRTNDAFHYFYTYWNPNATASRGTIKRRLFSTPAFEIQVSNPTQFAISFQRMTVRLVDDAGNAYPALLKQDLVETVTQHIAETTRNGWGTESSSAVASAKRLRVFDRNHESLPNLAERRILAFDFGNTEDENLYQQRMRGVKYFRLVLFNVPVKFDQTGTPIKVSKFEYVFDVRAQ